MKTARLGAFVLLASVGMICPLVSAQEVVHALTGVVFAVNPASNTITVKTNDGSEGVFVYKKKLETSIEFDKSVRSETTEPAAYNKTGGHVIVYFFGDGIQRTVVALKDIGKNPLSVSSGTVVGSRDRHSLTIKTPSGATEVYQVARETTVDTPEGVVSGYRFDPEKGSDITVRYEQQSGSKVAQFIRAD